MKSIIITNTKGARVFLRCEDILSIFEHPEDHVRIINFKQMDERREIRTEESLDALLSRLREIMSHD
jgi:hypothetical protein